MGSTKATYGVTDTLMVFKSSQNKEVARKFLTETAFAPKWRIEFSTKEGFLPVMKAEAAAPVFANDPQLKAFTDMLPYAHFAPPVANWEQMVDAVIAALQKVYIGQAEPEAALKEAADDDRRPHPAASPRPRPRPTSSAVDKAPCRDAVQRQDRARQRALSPHSPILLFAFWIIGYPIYDMANMSVHAVNRFGKTAAFNDFANSQRLFAHQLFIGCLIRTLVWTVFVVGGTVLLSVPIALILNEKFYGRTLARIIIMLPWAVSLTMSGIVWRWSLNGQFGMVNATLSERRPAGPAGRMAGDVDNGLPDRDRHRHPGLDPVHGDGDPRRPLLAAGRHLRGGQDRRRHRLAALPLSDAAAAPPVPQHRAGAELHLRLQLLPADLGDDAGRSGQQHRHPGHLALQARLPLWRTRASPRPCRSSCS